MSRYVPQVRQEGRWWAWQVVDTGPIPAHEPQTAKRFHLDGTCWTRSRAEKRARTYAQSMNAAHERQTRIIATPWTTLEDQ